MNGEYRGDSDLGKLMHDFNCTKADDMNFELMAERTRYFKENPEGVSRMCKIIEDMRNETRDETTERVILQSIKSLMETMKLTADQAMDALKVSDNDKVKYAGKL